MWSCLDVAKTLVSFTHISCTHLVCSFHCIIFLNFIKSGDFFVVYFLFLQLFIQFLHAVVKCLSIIAKKNIYKIVSLSLQEQNWIKSTLKAQKRELKYIDVFFKFFFYSFGGFIIILYCMHHFKRSIPSQKLKA